MKSRRRVVAGIGLAISAVLALLVPGSPDVHELLDAVVRADSTTPADYEVVVVFRNDDLEPGHSDDLRRSVDRIFVEEGVPLTNAVIPTADGESVANRGEFCRELGERQREHPNLLEYSLHGFLHEPTAHRFPDGEESFDDGVETEFGGLALDEQVDRIAKGKRFLSDCTGATPRSFSPPYGTYDDTTVRALEETDVSIVSGSSWFTDAYYGETEPFETGGVLHVPADQGFVEDWDTHEFHDQRYLREQFDAAYENGSLYVQILHYWTFDSEERLDALRELIRYVKGHEGVLFMTIGGFAEAYRAGWLRKVDGGWSYTPPDGEAEGVSAADLGDETVKETDSVH